MYAVTLVYLKVKLLIILALCYVNKVELYSFGCVVVGLSFFSILGSYLGFLCEIVLPYIQ